MRQLVSAQCINRRRTDSSYLDDHLRSLLLSAGFIVSLLLVPT